MKCPNLKSFSKRYNKCPLFLCLDLVFLWTSQEPCFLQLFLINGLELVEVLWANLWTGNLWSDLAVTGKLTSLCPVHSLHPYLSQIVAQSPGIPWFANITAALEMEVVRCKTDHRPRESVSSQMPLWTLRLALYPYLVLLLSLLTVTSSCWCYYGFY